MPSQSGCGCSSNCIYFILDSIIMESPIGSFLLEDCVVDHHDDRPSPPSLWRQVVASRYYRHHHRRLLLQGPHLMTTSLLFDHAMYLASIEPCRCRYSNLQENSNEMDCHCVAVTILRSTARRDDALPIRCRPRPRPERIDSMEKSDDVKDESDPWPTLAFRRIQIIYVKDMSDILHYLFTIASQPLHQQPWGGILIDQLDAIAMPPYQECHVAATTIMSQTGTSKCLYCHICSRSVPPLTLDMISCLFYIYMHLCSCDFGGYYSFPGENTWLWADPYGDGTGRRRPSRYMFVKVHFIGQSSVPTYLLILVTTSSHFGTHSDETHTR